MARLRVNGSNREGCSASTTFTRRSSATRLLRPRWSRAIRATEGVGPDPDTANAMPRTAYAHHAKAMNGNILRRADETLASRGIPTRRHSTRWLMRQAARRIAGRRTLRGAAGGVGR